ncbi:MAG TPA: DUF1573 domain-containing protein [Planctomycetes bacterium]|nr:DUF1573 domain-containing protein [Planctomycetaceae bacterium]HIM29134.1 DUF1573 domain-containing protein [Planctomycetota bacterium]
MRTQILALLLALAFSPVSHAQEWARKMFGERAHDFGTVARGAHVEYRFVFENMYKENVHIAYVRSSCGCTEPTVTKRNLKTWEKSEIVAKFNTRSFTGHRKATLTVTIDKPFYAEVQLNVKGHIRGDVVFRPGSARFGEIDQTVAVEKTIQVQFAGRPSWRIEDVRSGNKFLEVELSEPKVAGRRVTYNMTVRVLLGAPAGFFRDQLLLITNDRSSKSIPMTVEAKVKPAIEVSPNVLFMGIVAEGETTAKKLLIRGKEPFRIVRIECDGCFEFEFDPENSKKIHFVPVTFTANETGKVKKTIRVVTDYKGIETEFIARADVK